MSLQQRIKLMPHKPIVLFDMDGTLTLPREKADDAIIRALLDLSLHADIGVLTGSDMEYVTQQLPQISNLADMSSGNIDILPCNGTKRYVFIKGRGFEQRSTVSMLGTLGRETYNKILGKCCEWQVAIMRDYPDLPYTGTFIQYRGSLLNWCPIGRSAGAQERKAWVDKDTEVMVRESYQAKLAKYISELHANVTVALGGSTSFDIYPTGWDKTYGLTYYHGREAYFVGDKCQPGGNDWHIYEKLKPAGMSYETTCPEKTIEIIQDIISKVSKS